MADTTPDKAATTTPSLSKDLAAVDAANLQAQKDAEVANLDETEEGGHYVVAGQHVNAWGEPYKAGQSAQDMAKRNERDVVIVTQ